MLGVDAIIGRLSFLQLDINTTNLNPLESLATLPGDTDIFTEKSQISFKINNYHLTYTV